MNILIPYNLNTSTFSASTKISQKQLNRINAGLKIKQSFASLSGGAVVLVYFRLDLHDGVDEEADDAGLVGRHWIVHASDLVPSIIFDPKKYRHLGRLN
jgi:hypothetical protein